MANLRDHSPIVIDKFNGLWQRGDPDDTPLDHFSDCNNIRFKGSSEFATRFGVGIFQDIALPTSNIKRLYNYPTPDGNTLIALAINDDGDGEIYHVVDSDTTYGPLLTLAGMVDFAFLPYAGRGYISPIGYYTAGDLNVELGLENEFLYVYAGDGTPARKAAGAAPTGSLTIANGAAGNTDAGFHLFGVVFETDSGYLTAPGAITGFTTTAGFSVSFGTVPVGGATVTKRHLVATKKITGYTGDTTGYQFFFIPDGTINDNVTLFKNNVSFFDADLLDDASHLIDNFDEIPAGAAICLYHDRLCLFATFDDISLGMISAPGEPEAISQIDGIVVMPLDGNPITNCQELRDVLYTFKRAKTGSFIDNGDEPATWPYVIVDNALGTCIHGISTVLDSGSSNVDFLTVCTYQGISLFNGKYINPELSWKIEDFWRNLDRDEFRRIQILNNPIDKEYYIVLPNRIMLMGNYANGMDPKSIRWTPWSFPLNIDAVAIVNINTVILGASRE